jgi:hypothetical protein
VVPARLEFQKRGDFPPYHNMWYAEDSVQLVFGAVKAKAPARRAARRMPIARRKEADRGDAYAVWDRLPRYRGQSNAGPGSVLRPGAMSA